MHIERHVASPDVAAVVDLGYPVMTLESHNTGCELTIPTNSTAHEVVVETLAILPPLQDIDESQVWLPSKRMETVFTKGVERMLREGTVKPTAVTIGAGDTEVSWIAGPTGKPNVLIISDSYMRRKQVENIAGRVIVPSFFENIHELFDFADKQFAEGLAKMKMSD